MRIKHQTIFVIAVILYCVSAITFSEHWNNFQSYQEEYGKKYQSKAVQLYRFGVYLKNLQKIARLNLEDQGSATYGLTRFTDLEKHQIIQMVGLKIPQNFTLHYAQNFTNDPNYKPRKDIPDIWNWVQQGAVTDVKDQGTCGSCWTFSTVGNIQGLYYLQNKQLINFSQQQLIDCDKSNFGCSGGWPYMAIDWLSKYGGIQTMKDYPLRSNYSGPCQFNETKVKTKIKGYLNITRDQAIIKDALYQKGPLSILLDFQGLFHYKNGVASPRFCSTWPNHALVLVGYGVKDQDYWLIKNSWGPKWGINGYFMLKRGANKCGVGYWATTSILDQ